MDTKMNDIILVPTDFSEVCANAASQAAEAAKMLNHKVILLHVINSDTKAFLKNENLAPDSIDEKLKELSDQLSAKYQVKVEYLTKEGSIFTEIGEVVKDLGVSLVYLGTHGKVGLQHLTGSYALKVITSSNAPTVVVQKRHFAEGYKHIVLPITSEAGPLEKTRWAVYIAKKFNATIHIYLINDASDAVYDAARQIAGYLAKNDVSYTEKTSEKSSNFAKQVVDYSTAINADLMMIMTNPEKGFGSFLLGSYDEDIIFNTSQIPVMCINPRKFNYEVLGL
ncbi:MAG: universal stress protein [Lentimicrobiaceae bacterium]|nr:universal stress protein [Lentimicrobiaceae bacterium]MCO5264772.1 universal stress protein [Lentimicrobium sp.]